MGENDAQKNVNETEEFESFEDIEVENIISAGSGSFGCCTTA